MSHNVTSRDNLFTVREPAWHGLGVTLTDYPTREEAKALAHNWEPEPEPLYRRVTDSEQPGIFTERFEKVEDFDLVVRSDDRFTLGVKPSDRPLITNDEMYDISEALLGQTGKVRYETGGSLKGGRKVWLLLRFNEPLCVGGRRGTEFIPYFALQNAHDGSGSFRGQATQTMIVCDNTSKMADLDAQARGTEFVFRHTKNVGERIEEAKIALAGWQDSVETYGLYAEHMLHLPVDKDKRTLFVHEFIPMPPESLISDRVRDNILNDRMKMLGIFESPTQETIKDTAYGLMQAAIEYSQHYRKAKSAESLFKRAYLDRSLFTAKASDLAQRIAVGA